MKKSPRQILNDNLKAYERLRKQQQESHTKLTRLCRDLLEAYALDGCPCRFPRFVAWVSKPHGKGWSDLSQNELIRAALDYGSFTNDSPGRYTCQRCGAAWQVSNDEWRMGADAVCLTCDKAGSLLPLGPEPDSGYWYGEDYAGDQEHIPSGAKVLTRAAWKKYMTARLPSKP